MASVRLSDSPLHFPPTTGQPVQAISHFTFPRQTCFPNVPELFVQQRLSLETQADERFDGQDESEHRGSFSFVVIGCNRVDAADVSPENPSTANLEQLNRTFREIAALRPLIESR